MRCTELTLMPTASAIAALVQCDASCGGSSMVNATTRSLTEGSSFAMREGRVLSRKRPSTPSTAKRSCQRQTQVFDLRVNVVGAQRLFVAHEGRRHLGDDLGDVDVHDASGAAGLSRRRAEREA